MFNYFCIHDHQKYIYKEYRSMLHTRDEDSNSQKETTSIQEAPKIETPYNLDVAVTDISMQYMKQGKAQQS